MVKSSFIVVRDAQYEAQQRTVGIAFKPAVGKEMFSGVQVHESDGMFQGSFDTERFIHGKIREYVRRAATHWNSNQSADLNRLHGKIDHIQEDSVQGNPSETQLFRAASMNTLHLLQAERMPKALRSHVAANLLHDLGVEVRVNDSSANVEHNREELVARLRLHCIVRSLGRKLDVSQVASILSTIAVSNLHATDGILSSDRAKMIDASSRNIKLDSGMQSFSSKSMLQLACFVLVAGMLPFNSYNQTAQFSSGIRAQEIPLQSKIANSDEFSSKCGRHSNHHTIRKEEGFGTAPIWYQQSMATGPPLKAFSLDRKNNAVKNWNAI